MDNSIFLHLDNFCNKNHFIFCDKIMGLFTLFELNFQE